MFESQFITKRHTNDIETALNIVTIKLSLITSYRNFFYFNVANFRPSSPQTTKYTNAHHILQNLVTEPRYRTKQDTILLEFSVCVSRRDSS